MDGAHLLQDLAIVLGAAAVTTVLFRRLRQPVILGYLVAGLLVGPHIPFPLVADVSSVTQLSELGVLLVMFGIGLEFSVRRLLRVLPRAGIVGVIQIGGMLWLGYLAGQALGFSTLGSFFTGAALCISSTMVVARTFGEQGIVGPRAELVYSVLVVEDLAAILLLALLTALGSGGAAADTLAITTATLAAFLLGLVGVGFLLVPRAVRAVAALRSPETLLVTSMGLCFGLALLAHAMGYSVALGAFLAGSLVAESGEGEQVEQLVRPLRDVFAAIFLVAVGMSVDPGALSGRWGMVALLASVVVFGQTLFVSLGAFLSGHDVRTSVQAALSLAQIGEFSFIIAGLGAATGATDPALFPAIVMVGALTAFLTPLLVRGAAPLALALDRRLPHRVQTFVTLYGSWLETVRSSDHRHSLGRLARRQLRLLLIDALLLAAVVIGASLARAPLGGWLQRTLDTPPELSDMLVMLAAAAIALPFGLGLLRVARALGALLARAALPAAPEVGADFAAAPRRALLVSFQLGVVLVVMLPLLALTQPFLPPWIGAPLLALALLVTGVTFWRRTTDLAAHARAGAELVAELLVKHAGAPTPSPEEQVELQQAEQLLPGLGHLGELRLRADAPAVGRSLRELNLRGLTGASVIAISRDGARIVAPSAGERLRADDLLALAGTREALAAALELLARAPVEPARPGEAPR